MERREWDQGGRAQAMIDLKIKQYFQAKSRNWRPQKVEIKLASVDKCKTPRSLILDLSDAMAMSSDQPVPFQFREIKIFPNLTVRKTSFTELFPQEKVTLYCQAWAKNINTERIFVDKVTTNANAGPS